MALRALPRCWVQLAGVSGGEKTYSRSSIIIKIYPALSPAIGGQDGMDGGGGYWMMLPFWEPSPDLMLGVPPRCWARLAGFSGGLKLYSGSIIIIKIYPTLVAAVGAQEGMDCSRMSCSIYSTRHQSWHLEIVLVGEDVRHVF